MKLWLLRPEEDLPEEDDPWDPYYDKVFGFVIRAENEEHARRIANAEGDGEVCGKTPLPRLKSCDPWLYEEYSSCEELLYDGPDGVIIQDHMDG